MTGSSQQAGHQGSQQPTQPAGGMTITLGVALLVNTLLGLAILQLVTPDTPQLAEREPFDPGHFVRIPVLQQAPEPIERRTRPEPPPVTEPLGMEAQDAIAESNDYRQPPAPGPLSFPVPDVRIRAGAGGSGPWLGDFRPAAVNEGRTAAGYGSGLAGGGNGNGSWLPSLPSVRMHPEYPFQARRRGIEGHVLVAFTIGLDGRTADTEILEAKPPGVFDETVRRAVQEWRFSTDEQASLIDRRWQYRVVFSLKGD
jgi:periplasmic protein TonB